MMNNFNLYALPDNTLLTRFQVAQLLSISLVTLHNHKVKGLLRPTHKIGRKPLYLKSEVMKNIELPPESCM
jgi:hypothetical protein